MEFKSKTGKVAILFDAEKGVLIEGDGLTPLANNSWFIIESKASSGSVLPFEVGYPFKSPDSGNAITPIVGDNVYPIPMVKNCKVDVSMDPSTGTVDVTDDCSFGYNAMISDGFTDLSGSAGGFLKFDPVTGEIPPAQLKYLGRFFSIATDDGAGVYTLTEKDDSDIFLAVLQNGDQVAIGQKQQWLLFPAILSGISMGKPLKAGQSFDLSFAKGEGPATMYTRTTNSTEGVF
jgi:hypothetical protein